MTEHDISEELKSGAIGLGLCQKWQKEWGEPDLDALCLKYVQGLDFCIKHDFPDTEFMKDNFSGVMENHGIFVDNEIELVNRDTVIANGLTSGSCIYDGFSVGQIYARHDSNLTVIVTGHAVVNIRVYDRAHVTVLCNSEDATASVILHGGEAIVSGKVKVINRKNK